jgi:hypothetical protein
MHRSASAPVLAIALFLFPTAAVAQEEGKIGITMGFPASVGLLWHATENLAVRPEFSFAWNSTETGTVETDGTSFTTGASVLFYLRKWENLATYVSPRYSFSRSSSSTAASSGDSERTSRSHLFSGSFGAQYWLGDRFSAFGELGLGYQRGRSESDLGVDLPIETGFTSTSHSFATRSAVGIVFYF